MPEGKEPENMPEPSMEEILASIRRIIADEDTPKPDAAAAPGDDVVELTQLVEEDGSVKDLKPAEPAAPPPPPPPAPAAPPPPPKEAPMAPPLDISAPSEEALVSDNAANSASASLSSLEKVVDLEKMATNALPCTPLGDGKRTLEGMVMELMKPMLKEWLDQNLPALVERMVQKEIERISKHGEG